MLQTVQVGGITIGEGRPKICVPITSCNIEDILEEARKCRETKVDLVEWRVDFYEHIHIVESVILTAKNLTDALGDIPLIFTCRTEDGAFSINSEEYRKLIRNVLASEVVKLIDVELSIGDSICREIIEYAHSHGAYVILSSHDFKETPEVDVLVERMKHMSILGGDIPKLAVMPHTRQDVLKLLRATEGYRQWYGDKPIITMSMGEMGSISRVGGGFFGSAVTFASMKGASAPGQLALEDMRIILDILYRNS